MINSNNVTRANKNKHTHIQKYKTSVITNNKNRNIAKTTATTPILLRIGQERHMDNQNPNTETS